MNTSASIGPAGVVARASVGLVLIGLELFWRDPKWWDPIVAVAIAVLILGFFAVRASRRPAPLDATGPGAHALNVLVALALLALPATSGGALLFYGGTMLVAAVRRNRGCEVTVVSNALLGRADEVGCALFAPVDVLESKASRTTADGPSA
jgi:hypothetical protein